MEFSMDKYNSIEQMMPQIREIKQVVMEIVFCSM
jgi:hypothetical protein